MSGWLNQTGSEQVVAYVKHKFERLDYENTLIDKKTRKCVEFNRKVAITASMRQRFFGHFPHFCEMYLRFYSIMLWQRIAYNLDNEACINSFQVDLKMKFWNSLANVNGWTSTFLKTINTASGYETVDSNINFPLLKGISDDILVDLPNSQSHFLHPSDSLMLTSTILRKDPCSLHGKGKELISPANPITVAILNRSSSRKIINVENTKKAIIEFFQDPNSFNAVKPVATGATNTQSTITFPNHIRGEHLHIQHPHTSHNTDNISNGLNHMKGKSHQPANVSIIYFEGKSFYQQIELMSNVDIVIGVHGAGLTNHIFMKPCSIMIEVFPWLYNLHSNFELFSSSAGILHYSWEEIPSNVVSTSNSYQDSKQSTPSKHHRRLEAQGAHYAKCDKYREKYLALYESGKYSFVQLDDMCHQDGDGDCRACARDVEGLIFDLDNLRKVLSYAVKDRQKCIAHHPFYSGN